MDINTNKPFNQLTENESKILQTQNSDQNQVQFQQETDKSQLTVQKSSTVKSQLSIATKKRGILSKFKSIFKKTVQNKQSENNVQKIENFKEKLENKQIYS